MIFRVLLLRSPDLGAEGQRAGEDRREWGLGNSSRVSADAKAAGLWAEGGARDQGGEQGGYRTVRMWRGRLCPDLVNT